MDVKHSRPKGPLRFALWTAALDLALMCATLGLSWVLHALLPCRIVRAIDLSCTVLGVDLAGLMYGAGMAAWLWIAAQLLFVPLILLALLIAASEWTRASIKARSS